MTADALTPLPPRSARVDLSRKGRGEALPLFHHADYAPPLPPGHRFPMSKYALLPGELAAQGQAVHLLEPEAMPPEWLHAVHDSAYVDAVLAAAVPPAIERRIGLPVTPAVARRTRLVAGGTHGAALHALAHGWAANGAGGSHHAGPEGGAGYCVTNDLAIAANRLVHEGAASRILIVDCDVHQGDGTARIMAGRSDIITLSIHAEKNFPARKAQSHLDIGLPDGTGDADYLAALQPALHALLARHRPQLVLYQAGVDVHRDDRLGRLALSDDGLAAREALVARSVARAGAALAVTLGGGYAADPADVARRHALVLAASWQAWLAAARDAAA
jgi:acetoin utilization deacetylase AcuC-like enzyme